MPPENRLRLPAEERREIIVKAAVKLTEERGNLFAWTRQDVADACEVPTNVETVKHYYSMDDLRGAVASRT